MFTPNQISSLKALKVQSVRLRKSVNNDLELKDTTTSVTSSPDNHTVDNHIEPKYLNWHDAPTKLIDDLSVLFPNLKIVGTELHLSANLIWLSAFDQADVTYEQGVLTTPSFNQLSKDIKAKIWPILKPQAVQRT